MKTNQKPILTKQQLNNLSKEQLVSLCGLLIDKNTEYESRLDYLTEQVILSRSQKFGASSEKDPSASGQMSLFFNEAEAIMDTTGELDEDSVQIQSHKRKKRKEKGIQIFQSFQLFKSSINYLQKRWFAKHAVRT